MSARPARDTRPEKPTLRGSSFPVKNGYNAGMEPAAKKVPLRCSSCGGKLELGYG